MITYFVMHRQGSFEPNNHTVNQCKEPGHDIYYYHLKLVFDGSAKLNDQAFLIDHQDLDDLITSLPLAGSCEQMQQQINKVIVPMIARRKLPLLACKCTLQPSLDAGAPAWLEFISLKSPEFASCLPLI